MIYLNSEVAKTAAKLKMSQHMPSMMNPHIGAINKMTAESLLEVLATFKEFSMCNLALSMNDAKSAGRYTAWMELCQNEVQQAARGYGEHLVASDAYKRIQECDNQQVVIFYLLCQSLHTYSGVRVN